jgi:esterase/lipase
MRNKINAFLGLILLLGAFYLLGPRVENPQLDKPYPEVPDLKNLEAWLAQKESQNPDIKPNNAAEIIFFDSLPQKTKISVVYLHGFSASAGEGMPGHIEIAKALKANLYLPRLYEHGLDKEDPLLDFTAEKFLDSAREAIAIAAQLGEQIVVLGTSTGGTLALQLADHPQIVALGLYSPNVAVYDSRVALLSKPWGVQLAKLISKGNFHTMDKITEEKKKYWTTTYRVESGPHLQKLIDVTMRPKTFQKVKVPVFMGYYYKNDSLQDQVVSVSAMKSMFAQLGTPEQNKRQQAFPDAGDHVIIGAITNPNYQEVVAASIDFFTEKLMR